MVLEFNALLLTDERKGMNTLCTYFVVPLTMVRAMNHWEYKKSFRVKGHVEFHKYEMFKIAPVGDGTYIFRLDADTRKGINKVAGDMVRVRIQKDRKYFPMDMTLHECLKDEDMASFSFYMRLPKPHQNYFNEWIATAKTEEERAERIARTLDAFKNKKRFREMQSPEGT